MRALLIVTLREHWSEADDPTTLPMLIGDEEGPRPVNGERLPRLMLRAIREHEQEIRELRQRIVALEAKLP